MELPVRVRQIGPPFDSTEVTTTMDVSRNGVLFCTRQAYMMNSTVWVTMPYHPDGGHNNLEFPASVVRIDRRDDGAAEIAVQFHSSHADKGRPVYQAAPSGGSQKTNDRRVKNRVRMTLPIRVRDNQAAEESVTVDVSRTGVLFSSPRPYPVGEQVWVVMPYQPGAAAEEVPARVVRNIEQSHRTNVALHFTSAKTTSSSGSFYSR